MAARRPIGMRSRVVRILKIGFPMVAFGLLASVFLLSNDPLPEAGLSFSQANLAAMQDGLQVTRPQLSGASLTGDIYDFRAASVIPRDSDITAARIDALTGSIAYLGGPRVDITAASAEVDFAARELVLDTGIRLGTSDGYAATADRVTVDIAGALLTATGGVSAKGPIGTIRADTLRIAPTRQDPSPALGKESVLNFSGSVRLSYQPVAAQQEE